jgi:hypothetical protein
VAIIVITALGVVLAGILSASLVFGGWGDTTPTATLTTTPTPTATATFAVESVVLNGARADADPASKPVRDAGPSSGGWADLAQLFGGDTPYTECVREVSQIDRKDWSTYEQNVGSELVIFASNTGKMTNAEIRRVAANDPQNAGVENLPNLPIRRVNGGFVNTKWSPDGGCEEFTDKRQLVRVSMVPVTNDGKLDMSRGVFIGCHNPWRLAKGEVKASPGVTRPPGTTKPRTVATRPPHVVIERCPDGTPVPRNGLCWKDPAEKPDSKIPRGDRPNPLPTRADHRQPNKPADPPEERKHTPAPPKATTTPRATPPPPRATGAPDPEKPGTDAPRPPGG